MDSKIYAWAVRLVNSTERNYSRILDEIEQAIFFDNDFSDKELAFEMVVNYDFGR